MAYTGTSIVDYLTSVGKPTDFASRKALATQSGITNYTGTAQQNTQLLSLLNKPVAPVTPILTPYANKPVPTTPTPLAPIAPKPITPVVPVTPISNQSQIGGSYTIQSGDTLSSIARRQGLSVQQLLQYNPQIKDPNLIQKGANLNLQAPAPTIPPKVAPEAKPGVLGADLGTIKTTTKDQTGATTTITEPVKPPVDTAPPKTADEAVKNPVSDYIKNTFGYDDEGIKKLFESFQMQPEKSFEELSQDIYGKLGLDKVKTQIDDLTSRISTIDNQSADAIAQINENPWLSEKSRSFRVQNIEERANKQKQTMINELNLATNQYNKGREEAMNAAQITLEQFNTNKKYDVERLQFMFDRAEQAATLAKKDEKRLDTQVIEAGGKKMLINSQTGEIIKELGVSELSKEDILTPTEASTLGVPYGTTKIQAIKMKITPARWKDATNKAIIEKITTTQTPEGEIVLDSNGAIATVGTDVDKLTDFISKNKFKFTEKESAALGVILALDDLAKYNPEGEFKGIAPIRKPGIFQSTEGRQNRQYIEAINLAVQQWASGAALTREQTKQVKKLTPDINDIDNQVKDKINGLSNYMLTQIKSAGIKGGVKIPVNTIKYSFVPLSMNEFDEMDNLIR